MTTPGQTPQDDGSTITPVVRRVTTPEDYRRFGSLVAEYLDSLGFEVAFQDVQRDVNRPEEDYGPPDGVARLALADSTVVGGVGLRSVGRPVCEMKRLYVRPSHRGTGLGRVLATALIEAARGLGYERMRLDTITTMTAANGVYHALGFTDIAACRHNPLAGARFVELVL